MGWTCGCGQQNGDSARFCNQCGAPRPPLAEEQAPAPPPAVPGPPQAAVAPPVPSGPPPAAAVVPAKKSSAPLIIAVIAVVMLLGVCVLGIIAAIAIPNFISAAQRGKQKRAMVDLRAIATACEAYRVDKGAYPDTGHNQDSYYSIVDASALKPLLEPSYIQALPETDAWGHPYSYGVSGDDSEFVLLSLGSDGEMGVHAMPKEFTGTHCFEDDIIWENDRFVQAPEGPQKSCAKGS